MKTGPKVCLAGFTILLLTFGFSGCNLILGDNFTSLQRDFRTLNDSVAENRRIAKLRVQDAKRLNLGDEFLSEAEKRYASVRDASDSFYDELLDVIEGRSLYNKERLQGVANEISQRNNLFVTYVASLGKVTDGQTLGYGNLVILLVGTFLDAKAVDLFKSIAQEINEAAKRAKQDMLNRVSDSRWEIWNEIQ